MPDPAPRQVTRLVMQKKNPNRVSVHLDGEFVFGLHVDLVARFELRIGLALSPEMQEQMEAEDRILVAKAIAMNYIVHRDRTAHEVRTKLTRKEFTEAEIVPVLARLTELGYLDDTTYAHRYVRARFAGKGYGPGRIRGELLRRGIARPLADAAIAELFEQEDAVAAARIFAEKRWPNLAREPDLRKRKKKLTDYLIRRGFSFDTIRIVVDEVAEGTD